LHIYTLVFIHKHSIEGITLGADYFRANLAEDIYTASDIK